MMELSTPVVTLWEGVLALPLIGTLDSERTQVVMENLLQRIVDTGSTIAIEGVCARRRRVRRAAGTRSAHGPGTSRRGHLTAADRGGPPSFREGAAGAVEVRA